MRHYLLGRHCCQCWRHSLGHFYLIGLHRCPIYVLFMVILFTYIMLVFDIATVYVKYEECDGL